MKNDILVFPTTRSVIKAEILCRSRGIDIRIVAVPRHISSECGMALLVAAGEGKSVARYLADQGIAADVHVSEPPAADFDLLTTVENGGCSAKLSAKLLHGILQQLPANSDPRLLVGVDTCDDAGVFKINDEIAIIETTDFFPPVCSDPYEFGQIAAANALSDVFAMGGKVLTAMNLVMFPAEGIPFDVLGQILAGGMNKVKEAGGVIAGGHSIADSPPKYGLAVTGIVHPEKVIANHQARSGQHLVLTKPIGTGILAAAQKIGETTDEDYRGAIENMKQLNRAASEIMQKYGIRAATDITGFGLLGHALNIARGSNVTLCIHPVMVPALSGARELVEKGCIPGAAMGNLEHIQSDTNFAPGISYEEKMLLCDPQTSGGILMCVEADDRDSIVEELKQAGYGQCSVIGGTAEYSGNYISVE